MARPRSITRATPYTPERGPLAGQTFYSQRQLDNAYARLKGFRSAHERSKAPKVARTFEQIAGLRRSEQETRRRAFKAVADMRRLGISRAEAARRNHTTVQAMMRHVEPALRPDKTGRYRATRSDSLPRPMQAITSEGPRTITLSGRGASRDASLVQLHRNAVVAALNGNEEPLDDLIRERGDDLSRLDLETDVVVLAEFEALGLLDDLDDPYAIEEAA